MKRHSRSVFAMGSACGAAVTVAASAMFGVVPGNATQVFVTAGPGGHTAHAWEADGSGIRFIGTAEAKKKEGAKDEDEDKSDKGTDKDKGKGKAK